MKLQALGCDPSLGGGQAQNGAPGLRLARTRLAHNAQALASQGKTDAAHGLREAAITVGEGHAQVIDHQHRVVVMAAHLAALGSSASRKPSPSRLNARLTRKIAAPGAAATHHWSST